MKMRCPYCGVEAEIVYRWDGCKNCGALPIDTLEDGDFATEEELDLGWFKGSVDAPKKG